ncbi:hypothetical protein C8R43DRAFT_949293 [Mycena crocata]|nr:hypothetical protein C8R43DRAFT_949293 [Mycena crocata]
MTILQHLSQPNTNLAAASGADDLLPQQQPPDRRLLLEELESLLRTSRAEISHLSKLTHDTIGKTIAIQQMEIAARGLYKILVEQNTPDRLEQTTIPTPDNTTQPESDTSASTSQSDLNVANLRHAKKTSWRTRDIHPTTISTHGDANYSNPMPLSTYGTAVDRDSPTLIPDSGQRSVPIHRPPTPSHVADSILVASPLSNSTEVNLSTGEWPTIATSYCRDQSSEPSRTPSPEHSSITKTRTPLEVGV